MKYYLLSIGLVLMGLTTRAQSSMNMDSLFNWQDESLVPSSAHQNTYNEIWGYAKNGVEYAIIGTTAGTHIFDVTTPATATEVAFIAGAYTGSGVVHRDYHDYQDYLYIVCDEGPSTLQIVDLRALPDTAIVVYDSDELFARSHNIFIDTATARLYMCGGTKELAVYSLANPIEPMLLVDCSVDIPYWSSVGYVHDIYVRNDTAFCNAGTRGLFVIDFSNISEPQMIGSLDTYPQQGYNHSGWLMPNAPYYAFADETHGTDIKITDVSNFDNIIVTDTIGANVDPNSIAHNLIYANGFLYVSFYFDGVYMFDCIDPAHPKLVGYYDTSTEQHAAGVYRGCWGVYPFLPSGNILVSDMQTGLWVLGHSLVSNVTESSEALQSRIRIFPNPASDVVYIDYPSQTVLNQFSVIDAMGKKVLQGSATQLHSIPVADLPAGLYTIVFVDAEGTATGVPLVKY